MRINQNLLAKKVTELEGGKINLSIAQVKEVQKLTFTVLINNFKGSEIREVLERYWVPK